MIRLKNREELNAMRKAGRLTAKICAAAARFAAPGITTASVDAYVAGLIRESGARSAFLGYRGFPGNICISVNEEVVHGVPGPRVIKTGDIVSIDVGVELEGFFGDMACTVTIGPVKTEIRELVSSTKLALEKAIEQARPGNRLSDISHAVESCAKKRGYSVVRDFVGHGIGRQMHEDPQLPNFGPPGKGPKLKAGMTLAIEPMINMGAADVDVMSDGWTVVARDRMCSAHFEHTVAIAESGAEILTVEG